MHEGPCDALELMSWLQQHITSSRDSEPEEPSFCLGWPFAQMLPTVAIGLFVLVRPAVTPTHAKALAPYTQAASVHVNLHVSIPLLVLLCSRR